MTATVERYRDVLLRSQRADRAALLRGETDVRPLTDAEMGRMVERYAANLVKARNSPQRRLILAMGREARRLSAALGEDLERLFDDLGRRAARAYREVAPLLPVNKQEPPTPGDEAVAESILRRMNMPLWRQDALVPAFDNHTLRTAQATIGTINAAMGLGVNLPDSAMRQVVANGGRRAGLLDISGETRRSIFRALADGRTAGEGPAALGRRIREYVPAGRFARAGPKYRAEMIARTETKWAQNVSSIEAYRRSDVVTGLMAFDAQTGSTDADCELRNGRVYSFEDAEREQALEHPNGTLSWAPVTGSAREEEERMPRKLPETGFDESYVPETDDLLASLEGQDPRSAIGQRRVADFTLSRGRADGNEHAVLVDMADGAVHAGTSGLTDGVNFSGSVLNSLLDGRKRISVYHNHPRGTALSRTDVRTMLSAAGVNDVTAFGHNGTVSIARPLPKVKKALASRRRMASEILDVAGDAVERELQSRVNAGRLSVDVARSSYSDTLNRLLHHVGIIDYTTSHLSVVEDVSSLVSDRLRSLRRELDDRIAD